MPLNFTGLSTAVAQAFIETGDFIRGHNLELLGDLLDSGVRVALVYGDRDYQCNCEPLHIRSILSTLKKHYANRIRFLSGLGGEQISLAIQSSSSASFRAAGYASISTNGSYIGGVVRQHGNLSFSRVFDAGHQGMPRSLFFLPPPH